MLPESERGKSGQTWLWIARAGIVPEVDCLKTIEGNSSGPDMLFLGSVASRDQLTEPGCLHVGEIVGNERLVLGRKTDRKPFLIAGIVDPELELSSRRTRRTVK